MSQCIDEKNRFPHIYGNLIRVTEYHSSSINWNQATYRPSTLPHTHTQTHKRKNRKICMLLQHRPNYQNFHECHYNSTIKILSGSAILMSKLQKEYYENIDY